jgi:heptosyltransferase-2
MKIICIQQRPGIGDLILFSGFMRSIASKYNCPVSILIKKNTKADQILKNNKDFDQIIYLDRSADKTGSHDGLGFFRLVSEIRKHKFDKAFIFNSSLRYRLLAILSGIKEIHQYTLGLKKDNVINSAKKLTEKVLGEQVSTEPIINVDQDLVDAAKTKYNISKEYKNIVLAPSASGEDKVWFIDRFIATCEKLNKVKPCKFYIAAGKNDKHLIDKIMNSSIGKNCISFENLTIGETLPIIKNCDGYLGNDTGFLHLSCALGLKCVAIFFSSPVLSYGTYSKNIACVIPKGETMKSTVHDLALGRERISVEEVYNKAKQILNL